MEVSAWDGILASGCVFLDDGAGAFFDLVAVLDRPVIGGMSFLFLTSSSVSEVLGVSTFHGALHLSSGVVFVAGTGIWTVLSMVVDGLQWSIVASLVLLDTLVHFYSET